MRILMIGQDSHYAALVQNTQTGARCHVELAGYQDGFMKVTPETVVLVEAAIGDAAGLTVARQILQHFPSITLFFLMKECQFEYSMAAMRMGAKNILVGEEINSASLEQILQREAASETTADQQAIARNFEKMFFFHGGGKEREWCGQSLNRAFDMDRGDRQFYMMIVTSLDFVSQQAKSETVMKKVRSETIRERLLQTEMPGISVPFVFYIDQLFYIVVLCDTGQESIHAKNQVGQVQQQISDDCQSLFGEKQILLSSRSKSDFRQLPECLDELDALQNVMHCGSFPCKMNFYSMPRYHGEPENMDQLLEESKAAVQAVADGGDYETAVRAIFTQQRMAAIPFSQFMKLKEHIFFELQSAYKRLESSILDKPLMEQRLEQLLLISNYPFALELILQIADQLAAGAGKRYHPLVTRCIRLVSEQYPSNISLQDMADTLNISNVYLSSLFRRETGKKFSAYVNEFRLEKAKELIDSGDQPLSQVYEMVGFTNQQYFSNCFKKIYGMTPSEYKFKSKKR